MHRTCPPTGTSKFYCHHISQESPPALGRKVDSRVPTAGTIPNPRKAQHSQDEKEFRKSSRHLQCRRGRSQGQTRPSQCSRAELAALRLLQPVFRWQHCVGDNGTVPGCARLQGSGTELERVGRASWTVDV